MSNPRFQHLFDKFLAGAYTVSELEELLKYLEGQEDYRATGELIGTVLQSEDPAQGQMAAPSLEKIKRDIRARIKPEKTRRVNWLYLSAAASVLLFVSISLYFYPTTHNHNDVQPARSAAQQILPGGNKATITLSNGRTITLGDETSDILNQEAGIKLAVKDGTITYEQIRTGTRLAGSGFNTITTPPGGQYKVMLSDGSKVWLNAGSALTFPVSFDGNSRTVELAGEGYFEVHPNKGSPFMVKTSDQEVKVLGTSFNINAYENEPFITTSLVDGAVRVTSSASGKSVLLKPGQQTLLDASALNVRPVDASDVAAWTQGLIVLNNADIHSIFRQIERWYNIEFITTGTMVEAKLSGELPRDINLSELLNALTINTGLKFKQEGRRVMVLR